ncbi:MAG TPA: chemotaxis protein CheW [Longimicrobiales bacterium]
MSSSAVAAEVGPNPPTAPQWVVFWCAGRRLGLPLDRVREILTPLPFTRLPGTGDEVCGLIGVRSRVVTAFDLGAVLGGESAAVEDHRVLVVEYGERIAAFVVEEVIAVAPSEVKAPPRKGGRIGIDRHLMLGTGEFEGSAFTALDSDQLLDRLLILT